MRSIERRVADLETRKSTVWRWLWLDDGQTKDRARKDAGIDTKANVIFFTWRSTQGVNHGI